MKDQAVERAALLQDLATVVLSLWAAHALRLRLETLFPALKPVVPVSQYAHLLLVFVPTWALCAERLHLYRARTLVGPLPHLLKTVLWAQAWASVALALILTVAQAPLNRSLIALYVLVSTVALLGLKALQRRWVRAQRGEVLALIVGRSGQAAEEELTAHWHRRTESLHDESEVALAERLQQGGVDEVVLPAGADREQLQRLLDVCQQAGLPTLLRTEALSLASGRPNAHVIGPTLYLAYEGADRPALLVKAVFDGLASFVLVLLTLPLMLAIAFLVKLTSPGPVLFVQQRGGMNGRPFPMLKFRTMREGAEAEREGLLSANEMDGPVFKIARDPRVTRVGRFLRRTSLDELPQLLNVLAGHMSLVGPRPLPVLETRALTGRYRRRLSMRPGITGLWQVSGRNDLGFKQWMEMDLAYVDSWSLGLDARLLLRTIPAMIGGRGAV